MDVVMRTCDDARVLDEDCCELPHHQRLTATKATPETLLAKTTRPSEERGSRSSRSPPPVRLGRPSLSPPTSGLAALVSRRRAAQRGGSSSAVILVGADLACAGREGGDEGCS